MKLKLKVWRQSRKENRGKFVTYEVKDISPDISFLEMLDSLNEQLLLKKEDPIVFDHDCREGICGTCGFVINGQAHGPQKGVTVCQLHMRHFRDGDLLVLEPFRARAFPVVKDLAVERKALDRVIQVGGYVSVHAGSAPDANALPIPKEKADKAFAAATCIGCGACVAACKNASAMLFVAAKISHLSLLPQGQVEKGKRVSKMVAQMDRESFGACTSTGSCSAACPKEISLENIARMNREYLVSTLKGG